MGDARTEEVAATRDAVDPHVRAGLGARFLDRFLPVDERAHACWIAGVAAALGTLRAVAYHPLQVFVSDHVASPGVEEFGFALRATAIADAVWVLVVGVLAWALFRYTRAPKAAALYVVLAGVLVGAVLLGNRLALDTVMVLASSDYNRSLWSDLQPIMLALAETVGVVLGAWLAQVTSGGQRDGSEGTLLPALGWEDRPLQGAAWLAVAYVAVRLVGQLAATLLTFGPDAYQAVWVARHTEESVRGGGLVTLTDIVAPALAYFLVGYWGVRRFGMPRTIWLAFLAVAVPMALAALQFLPHQLALAMHGGGFEMGLNAILSAPILVARAALPTFVGVWLATRPARVSVSSDTLPAEDHDHW